LPPFARRRARVALRLVFDGDVRGLVNARATAAARLGDCMTSWRGLDGLRGRTLWCWEFWSKLVGGTSSQKYQIENQAFK